jgi:hypothetical protein
MPFQKGRAKTGGRKTGVANVRSRQIADKAAETGTTPLEHMLAVLHDPKADPDRRDRMAVAAAPFVHPRLAVVDSTVRATVEVNGKRSPDELRAMAREAIRQAFAERPPLVEGEVVSKTIAGYTPNVRASGEASDEREG